MADTIEKRLAELGVTLPAAAAPAASYVTVVQTGNLLFTAGQLPIRDGALTVKGLVGHEVDVATGAEAARLCAINIIAQLKAAIGDLDKVKRFVKLTCFVASAPGFAEQHLVANGASDFIGEVFGEKGKHARSAVGMAALPLDAPVEIEAIVEIE
jgi:enamine deaminase RidA (YjgF/YER057c/UK114 family)